MRTIDGEVYLTTGEAADYLSRRPETLRRWRLLTKRNGRQYGPPCRQSNGWEWLYLMTDCTAYRDGEAHSWGVGDAAAA